MYRINRLPAQFVRARLATIDKKLSGMPCIYNIRNDLISLKKLLNSYLSSLPETKPIDPSKFDSYFNKEFYDNLTLRSEKDPIVTGYLHNDIYMRSRGELLVAEALDSLGLEYKYEPMIRIRGKICYPDFIVYLPEFNRCFFIEFLGRLDDDQYVADNSFKIGRYLQSGMTINEDILLFCGWENRMVSTESIVDDIVSLIVKYCRMYSA